MTKPFDHVELLARVRSSIHQKRLNEDLDHAAKVLFGIARAVESRDPTTGDHCERFGRYLGLPHQQIKALRWGGYLHDIGKVGIPDAILGKQGEHTPEEWEIMKSHVLIGEEVCRACAPCRMCCPLSAIIMSAGMAVATQIVWRGRKSPS